MKPRLVKEAPLALDPNFRIALPMYEGPLDLLLHLIQQHELNILDLPMAFVTEHYLAYLGMMQRLDLEVAVEYLVMAATLTHIKSKMLLPPEPESDLGEDDEEAPDPRAELIRRLLEYQKYKAAAETLGSAGIMGRDIFARGAATPTLPPSTELGRVSIFRLLDVLQSVFARLDGRKAFEISTERIGIQARMTQILAALGRCDYLEFRALLMTTSSVYEVVVTFLAVLEMAKSGTLHLTQVANCAAIHLQRR